MYLLSKSNHSRKLVTSSFSSTLRSSSLSSSFDRISKQQYYGYSSGSTNGTNNTSPPTLNKINELHSGVIKKTYSHYGLGSSVLMNDIKHVNNNDTTHTSSLVIDTDNQQKLTKMFQKLFLPKGYPQSVTHDYSQYMKWMFLQNTLGSTTYVLSTHALLTSVGVGLSTSLPFAAAISWVLKDGLGASALVLFASKYSTSLDYNLKSFKFRGDILHNVGVMLEMLTPFVPGYFLPLASVSNLSKGLAGLIYGATRASLNRSFSLQENLGDITAKYQSQSMASYLTGMGLGTTIGLLMSPMTTTANLCAVFIISLLHMSCSVKSLKSICLKTLNSQRSKIIIDHWLREKIILSPEIVNKNENFMFSSSTDTPKIHFGSSIDQCFKGQDEIDSVMEYIQNNRITPSQLQNNNSNNNHQQNGKYSYVIKPTTNEKNGGTIEYHVLIIDSNPDVLDNAGDILSKSNANKELVDNLNMVLLQSFYHIQKLVYNGSIDSSMVGQEELVTEFITFTQQLLDNDWNPTHILFEYNDVKLSLQQQ
ncbi:DUF647 family protein [Cavenderia fasciculata]|uniref:DUF647 family protein n=1 Tax=Cavenderia fasciculata TaxID=261658 RepID=F4PV16_CACFS|nr:DUF647 family protein [Cavenderia fasciculata]EGG21132.1 DUF647 family protein [Cavenderia fasciculata]|eukprot:XP_004358982.1 DUF647 family protein [Cavenderia fasciculata]